MPEITIKYKSKRALEALRDLAKYFDYVISTPGSKEKKATEFERHNHCSGGQLG